MLLRSGGLAEAFPYPTVPATLTRMGMLRAMDDLGQRTATTALGFRLSRVRDFRLGPIIVLKQDIAVADSARR